MKIRAFLFIILLGTLVLALATGFTLLWRVFLLAVLVLLVNYLWVLLSSRGIGSQFEPLPKRCQVGDFFDEDIILFNGSRIPKLLLKVEENTDLPGHHNISVVNLSAGGSHRWQSKVYCQRRGLYRLGSITVTISDPFGLFNRQLNLGEPQNILVCPATFELPFFEPLSSPDSGYSSGRQLISQIGSNVASVREYTTGDSLRHIHWHSTAHTGMLVVKVFEPDRSSAVVERVWVVVDMHQPSQSGKGHETTEEYGIATAASLIKRCLDGGFSVGLIAVAEQAYLIPPENGYQHLWQMLTALALMKATGDVPIDQLISSESGRFGIDSVVIVITPSSNERLAASLRQIKSHGSSAVAVLLDSTSFGGHALAPNMVRALVSSGVQVHVVRRGDDLATALDSRVGVSYVRDVRPV